MEEFHFTMEENQLKETIKVAENRHWLREVYQGIRLKNYIVTPQNWLKETFRRVHSQAHYWFPNMIAHPNGNDQEYYNKRDIEQNPLTRVPNGEKLRVHALWGVEVYGPSEIDALYSNLERLGWDIGPGGNDAPGATHWIKEQRMYGSVGNYNIGVVTRKAEKNFVGVSHFLSLPNEVDYLLVYVYQLSASLTCVRIGFILSVEAASWYQHELMTDRVTTRVPIRGRRLISIFGVEHLKARAIEKTRERYRALVTDWFKKELPGFFSNAIDGNRLPTAEFLTTELDMLVGDSKKTTPDTHLSWRRLILNVSPFNIWKSVSCKGLFLVLDEFNNDARFHSVIALRTSDVEDEQVKHYGGRVPHAFVAYCETQIGGALVFYASIAFLREGDRIVKLTRERLRSKKGGKNVLELLENIKSYFSDAIGQPAIARELLSETKDGGCYRHWCEEFTMEVRSTNDKKYSLPLVLCERTKLLATKFIEEEEASREQFEQLSSILNTQESVKAQKRMERLTIIALFVAFASLVVALPELSAILLSLKNLDVELNSLLHVDSK